MPSNKVESHLKEACQLTAAVWAALAEREGGQWFVRVAYHLPKPKQSVLTKFLAQDSADSWLASALKGNTVRSASLPVDESLLATRLYVYPLSNDSQVILVGSGQQNANAQRVWRLVAGLMSPSELQAVAEELLPSLQIESPYDMPRALDRVLANFLHVVKLQGAWLAIRRGDTLDILAQSNEPRAAGLSLPIDSNRLLRRMNRTLTDMAAVKGQPEWADLPYELSRSHATHWICLPLVIGQRLIGAVALWATGEFGPAEWKRLREIAHQVSPSVEVIVTFNELTTHLRRLAMLNDFALTISSAQNLDQIARRVFGLLARSFGAESIALQLLSVDGKLIREFRIRDGKFSSQSMPFIGHPLMPLLKNERVIRFSDADPEFQPSDPNAHSGLVLPLKYRSEIVGLLSLESTRPDAFGQYDENLIVVIASHLAGLVEYTRLREEAEARARNLGLIHEMVQQVIGLNDKKEMAQITADLLAQYFAYELAGVVLVDGDSMAPVLGFGGSRAELVLAALQPDDSVVSHGITGHVFHTGQSVFLNDTSQDDKLYRSLHGWEAGSELCVALKDGDRILGVIDVESSQRNAFSNNDLLAMESLAGVLSTVVSSADQYQRLQDTVRQLRAAQVELRARMVAEQEAENRLVQAAKLAAVGEMAAGIAHELNNPLTTVTGFTELVLEETPETAPHRAEMEMVLREARRARDVVRRLLDFARQGERTRARFDMNELVQDVVALTRHLIHTNGVQLEIALADDLPWVSVDGNQMKQVLLNLVHNALQAMPSGGTLEIQSAERARDDHRWVTISVKDSGVGIDPQNKQRIFEPFFTTKASAGGTGLGLSVTYGIVTDHGGTIEVESQPGVGSTFTVWLPV